jgi:hypothetical protein
LAYQSSPGRHAAVKSDVAIVHQHAACVEAAAVIAGVIDSRRPDAYTRPDAHKRVVDYYAKLAT